MSLKSETIWANGLAVILAIAGLFAASVACSNPDGAVPIGESTATAVSQPVPTIQVPDGSTWILQGLDGSPLIEGTFAWLNVDGHTFTGFDGCNNFGGRSEDGTPVAGAGGEFTLPPAASTLIGCQFPHGILDQADSYLELLRLGERFSVDGDRLEIVDSTGAARLVFVRQVPLSGRPAELPGTQWQLVGEGKGGDDVKAATLAFVDEHLVAGTTGCRGYVASYDSSGGRLGFPAISMMEYEVSSCSEEMREREGRFTDDLSQALEYSVSEEEGAMRLMIRTSRGKTVTFSPLANEIESVFDVVWYLTAFVSVGQRDSDMGLLRTSRLIPGTEMTVRFSEGAVGGSAGCNSYGSQPESGGILVNEDGTFDLGDDIGRSLGLCTDPAGIMEQEKRYMELIPKFERYRIYGSLLVVHTEDGTILLFQTELFRAE